MASEQRSQWIGLNAVLAIAIALCLTIATNAGTTSATTLGASNSAKRPGLSAFQSDGELRAFLKKRAKQRKVFFDAEPAPSQAMDLASSASAPAGEAERSSGGITNNQEAGVDEGDIVKLRGDILVTLRRGRLFTVSIAHGGMRRVDHIDAFPPGVDARDDWYDEMLIAGNHVVVIGYSYSRGGTEINRFTLDDGGHLRFEDAYQLRSNDYYSSRNYASRLVGNRLVFYSPLILPAMGDDPLATLPAMRRWDTKRSGGDFRRISSAQQVFIPESLRDDDSVDIEALHTVTTCDLTAPVLDCTAISVLGPESRTFYVSERAVYVWVGNPWPEDAPKRPADAILYRMPLDGARPSAVETRGAPVDQFSFREDPARQILNVLVRSDSAGDAMWRPEFTSGAVALLSIPFSQFGDGRREVSSEHYRMLPRPASTEYDLHDRFVGNYLLYGTGNDWGMPTDHGSALVVASVDGDGTTVLRLPHGVDRIEALGRDALVVGSDSTYLHLQAVELTGGGPRLGDRYEMAAAQSETRSHAFFFKPDPTQDPNRMSSSSGVLGLPVAQPAREAYRQLFENSASMIFVRRQDRHFAPMGELAAATQGIADDDCKASCVDWYGNARPIFADGRSFALLGYELVEGRVSDGHIHEVGRVNFAPGSGLSTRTPMN